jgi:para-aminobenzoate synthetase component 1
VERLPDRLPVDPSVPEWAFSEFEFLLVADRRDRRLFATGTCDPHEGPSRLLARQSEALDLFDAAERAFYALPEPDAPDLPPAVPDIRAEIDRETYLRRVETVLRYIRAGDIFQANLAQRFTGTLRVPVPELYRRLRAASPAPYGGLWRIDGAPDVLSVSPELFLRRTGDRVVTKPIKGTRPRGGDAAADAALLAELRDAEKDGAELAMIVDLLRNDLGRVARTGSVRVTEPRTLVTHPTVHHAVATVECETDRRVHAADLVRATMPGGSITGAPKIRAMEILEELEDVRRGPYCGSAGWIGRDGDLALNILIRTLVVTPGVRGGAPPGQPSESRVTFHVGGGIVADSQPALEHEETLVKAKALLRASRGRG